MSMQSVTAASVRIPRTTTERLVAASDPFTPGDVLAAMAEKVKHDDVLAAVIANPNTPAPALAYLVREHSGLDDAIARHPAIDTEVVEALWRDGQPNKTVAVLAAVSGPLAPAENLKSLLSNTADTSLLTTLAQVPGLAAEAVAELATYSAAGPHADIHYVAVRTASVRTAVAARPGLDTDLVAALAADDDVRVRIVIAGRSDLPGDVVKALVSDKEPAVIVALIAATKNPWLLDHIAVEEYSGRGYQHPQIRLALAASPADAVTLADMTDREVSQPFISTEILAALAANPSTPPEALRKLGTKTDRGDAAKLRLALAANPANPSTRSWLRAGFTAAATVKLQETFRSAAAAVRACKAVGVKPTNWRLETWTPVGVANASRFGVDLGDDQATWAVSEIERRGGETDITGLYGTVELTVDHRSQDGVVVLSAEGWRAYSKAFGARRASLAYVAGVDDNGPWAARIPYPASSSVEDALAAVTPKVARDAAEKGRRVLRQGDAFFVETRAHLAIEGSVRNIVWDAESRTYTHRPSDGRAHQPVHVPFPHRVVFGEGRGMGRWGNTTVSGD